MGADRDERRAGRAGWLGGRASRCRDRAGGDGGGRRRGRAGPAAAKGRPRPGRRRRGRPRARREAAAMATAVPAAGTALRAAARQGRRGRGRRRGGDGGRDHLPCGVGAAVPRPPGQPARLAGPEGRRPVRGAASEPDPVRRHRLRRGPGRCPRRPVYPGRRGHRHRRLARRARRTRVGPPCGRPAGAGVLRAHHQVRPRHRARMAVVGPAGLPALPHAAGPAARSGERADEPAGGTARRAQQDRHRDRSARQPAGHQGLDPVLRGHRRADLRRHLHHVPARGAGVRERRLSAAAGELHRHARTARPARRRPDP